MNDQAYDARSIANLILDIAETGGLRLQHIALQKLLFFAHASFLVQQGRPLVSGAFEGWQYGPVHPSVYRSFKSAGEKPLVGIRAKGQDVLTGAERILPPITDSEVRLHVMQVVSSYGRLSTSRLIELSHVKDGPWDFAVNGSGQGVALGTRITDDVIRERFARPVRSVTSINAKPDAGEPAREEEPSAEYRSR